MQFIDTHCHIHFDYYTIPEAGVLQHAADAGVTKMLCVGCTLEDSAAGVDFVQHHDNLWASIGLHPHEGAKYADSPDQLAAFAQLAERSKVVAIGECGLDYYYNHSPHEQQEKIFRFQLELAKEHNLPLIFHVREAFDDFFKILDEYGDIRGVVHSFSTNTDVLTEVIARGLYVGLNGIMTFTKDPSQLAAAKAVPLSKMLLETDAPYLTPKPFRGTMCEPKHVVETARFLAELREEKLEDLAHRTTQNANELFGI